MIGQKHHDRVIGIAGFIKRPHHGGKAIVRSADRTVIMGQFPSHLGMIKQKPRHGNFIGRVHPGGDVRIVERFTALSQSEKGFMRIGNIDVQTKRFAGRRCHLDAATGGTVIRRGVLERLFLTIQNG